MFSLESENEIKLRTLMLDLSTNDVIWLNIPYPPKLIKVIDDFLTPLLRPSIMVKFCLWVNFGVEWFLWVIWILTAFVKIGPHQTYDTFYSWVCEN